MPTMPQNGKPLLVLSLLLLCTAGAACKKQAVTTPTPAQEPQVEQKSPPPPPPVPVREPDDFKAEPTAEAQPTVDELIDQWNRQGVLKTVYFDYDSSELSEVARGVLRANSDWLKGHREAKVVIEGHCDERGTIEYNLALGERRAASVRDYLTSLGVERPRIRILTYGEERPADAGHSEGAWAKNRRGAFVLER
jgi:peptidoglycan-associated lipoprotein